MSSTRIDRDELRTLFLFEALTDDQLDWLAARGELRTYDAGTVVVREGEPADGFYVLVDGALRLTRQMGGEDVLLNETSHRGSYGGALRAYIGDEQVYATSITTTAPSRFFRLPAHDFGEFVRTTFPMAVHLLDGLFVGIRNSEAQIRQREHLASLGWLSANLAHELNNPASAAVRATAQLRERVAGMRHKLAAVADARIPPETIGRLVDLQDRAIERASKTDIDLGPLERSDAEDELATHLEGLGVGGADDLAAIYVAAGLDPSWVDEVVAVAEPSAPEAPLRWLAYSLESEALMEELEDSAARISTLVAAVKQYAHRDSAAQTPVDLRPGLDSTIVMLGAKLAGLTIERDYDTDLPAVPAFPAELNQVWTNLLVNAAQALDGHGTITVRTRRDGEQAVVEITDDGPGIDPGALPHVFDAFFTTKAAGSGSGLGLDNARRIVERRHGGSIEVDSSPGGTTLRVRLPLEVTAG